MIIILFLLLFQIRKDYYRSYIDFLIVLLSLLCLFSIVVTIIGYVKSSAGLQKTNRRYKEGDSLSLQLKSHFFFLCPNVSLKATRRIIQDGKTESINLKKTTPSKDNAIEIEKVLPGTYSIDIKRIWFVGYFGIFRLFRKIDKASTFIVYPRAKEFDYSKLKKFKQNGEGITSLQKGDDYTELYEVRDFVEGDNMKYLHHALSQKFNRNMIKVGSKSERIIYLYDIQENIKFRDIVDDLRKITYIVQSKKIKENNSFVFVNYRKKWKIILNDNQLYKFIEEVYKDYEK